MDGHSGDPNRRGEPRSITQMPMAMLGAVIVFLLVIVASAIAIFAAQSSNDEPQSQAAIATTVSATITPSPTSAMTPAAVATGIAPLSAQPTPTQQSASVPPTAVPPVETPTAAPEGSSDDGTAGSPTEISEPEPTSQWQPQPEREGPLLDLLPGLADVPDGYEIVNEGPLTIEQAADLHPNPEAQRQRLRDWGFRESARREFRPSSENGAFTTLIVGVVDFGSPEQARVALDAGHAEVKEVAADTTDADAQVTDAIIERIGDYTLAAEGTVTIEGETIAVAYVFVQDGSLAYTIIGLVPPDTGSPLRTVTDVARAIEIP